MSEVRDVQPSFGGASRSRTSRQRSGVDLKRMVPSSSLSLLEAEPSPALSGLLVVKVPHAIGGASRLRSRLAWQVSR
jgi:hypothetical protein